VNLEKALIRKRSLVQVQIAPPNSQRQRLDSGFSDLASCAFGGDS